MSLKRPQSGRGFTLVEFLVYFFILGIVLTAVTSFTFDVLQTRVRVRLAAEVEQNMRFSMQRALRAVRTAESLNVGASTFDDADGVLSLQMSDVAADPTVFDLLNGVLRITEGASGPTPLTTDEVVVEKFWIEGDTLPGGTKAVTIQMEVRSLDPGSGPGFDYVSSTSSTAVIRRQR